MNAAIVPHFVKSKTDDKNMVLRDIEITLFPQGVKEKEKIHNLLTEIKTSRTLVISSVHHTFTLSGVDVAADY